METVDNTKVKNGFETKKVLVTPEIAKSTIKNNNLPNRNLNKTRVKYLAEIMKSGRFFSSS